MLVKIFIFCSASLIILLQIILSAQNPNIITKCKCVPHHLNTELNTCLTRLNVKHYCFYKLCVCGLHMTEFGYFAWHKSL